MTAIDFARDLLTERNSFPIGSPDWLYRTRAAWRLDQIGRGVPAAEWTDTPQSKRKAA